MEETVQIPWADFVEDFERFGREAMETLNNMELPWNPQAALPTDMGLSWPYELTGDIEYGPYAVSNEDYPLEPGPDWLPVPQAVDDPQTTIVDGFPLPPVASPYDGGVHSGDWDGGNNTPQFFPGGGTNDHQSTQELTYDPLLEAGGSTGLVPSKPTIRYNNYQTGESSSPATSSSSGGYNRTQNDEEKRLYLARIREVLGIPPQESEISTLQQVIRVLGRTAPEFGEQPGSLSKSERQAMQRDRRRRCYEELKDEVSPSSVKICERKILTEVLERITSPASADGYHPFRVFRAW